MAPQSPGLSLLSRWRLKRFAILNLERTLGTRLATWHTLWHVRNDIVPYLGALFAAVATLETLCTLFGAAIFNSIYPLFLHVGLNGFCFLVMAALMVAALILTE